MGGRDYLNEGIGGFLTVREDYGKNFLEKSVEKLFTNVVKWFIIVNVENNNK